MFVILNLAPIYCSIVDRETFNLFTAYIFDSNTSDKVSRQRAPD